MTPSDGNYERTEGVEPANGESSGSSNGDGGPDGSHGETTIDQSKPVIGDGGRTIGQEDPPTRRDDGASLTRVDSVDGRSSPTVDLYGVGDPDEFVGSYKILALLGQGGQGAVYRAEDRRVGRVVALKVLKGATGAVRELVLRFRREAEITAKLEHPSICPVYEVGLDEATPFIAMRLVEGKTLAQLISASKTRAADRGEEASSFIELGSVAAKASDDSTTSDADTKVITPVERREMLSQSKAAGPSTRSKPILGSGPANARDDVFGILAFIEKTARALHDAHETGVIHRDIKPGNIMLQADGTPVILDFGLAYEEDHDGPSLSFAGQLMGTPAYMAPEQIAAKRIRVDRRADVYSLGVTLFECLTLERPFRAPTREGLHHAITFTDPPAPRSLNAAIPRDAEIVLLKALEKDPDVRYQTAIEFAEELRRVRSFEPITTRPVSAALRHWRWIQRNPGWATAAYGIVIALSMTAVVFYLSNKKLNASNAALEKKTNEANANAARAEEESEAKGIALSEKTIAVESYERLADTTVFADAAAEEETFYPVGPELVPRIEAWKRTYLPLFERLALHESTIVALRAKARPYTDAQRALDYPAAFAAWESLKAKAAEAREKSKAAPSDDRLDEAAEEADVRAVRAKNEYMARPQLRADFGGDKKTQFQYDTLQKLVSAMQEFTDPDGGPYAEIDRRLQESRTIVERTIGANESEWRDAITRITSNPKYGGLVIKAQVGLIPIGPDRDSTLEEFYDPQTGEAPLREESGKISVTEKTAIAFVLIPGGTFVMGAQSGDPEKPDYDRDSNDNESPPHEVALDAFFLAKYEITQAQWIRTARAAKRGERRNPSNWTAENYPTLRASVPPDLRRPVEQVSFEDVKRRAFELGCVLPTEAQWEYACRAGTTSPQPSAGRPTDLGLYANLSDARHHENFPASPYDASIDDGFVITAPVGSKRANRLGLHDMQGNVWEWCLDRYGPYRGQIFRAGDGLSRRVDATDRPLRGGSFRNLPLHTRSTYRARSDPSSRQYDVGFRPARAVVTE